VIVALIVWTFAVLFVALKLTGHIDWSWWWVFAPVWGVAAVGATLFCIGVFMHWLALRLETPEEKVARTARDLADAIRKRRQ
jgi:uncharacterized membrane protein